MLYGYVRISTPGQNIDRQIRNIHRRYPVALIVQEIYTGRTLDRPKWRKLLKQLKPGDIIIFDSVSVNIDCFTYCNVNDNWGRSEPGQAPFY